MPNHAPEGVFDIERLLGDLTRAVTSSALALRDTFEGEDWKDSDVVYRMPRAKLSVRLSLSYQKGKVKGVFNKASSKNSQAVESTIDLEFVAVPRT